MLTNLKGVFLMNIEEIVNSIDQFEIENIESQLKMMESVDIALLRPVNMLVFES